MEPVLGGRDDLPHVQCWTPVDAAAMEPVLGGRDDGLASIADVETGSLSAAMEPVLGGRDD